MAAATAFTLRDALPSDEPFLSQIFDFALSFDHPPAPLLSAQQRLLDHPEWPELLHYTQHWRDPAAVGIDLQEGLIALDAAGVPVGAAWYRRYPRALRGFAHVSWLPPGAETGGLLDETTPEVAIGVLPHCRGRGAGGLLLEALKERARGAGVRALSLSVDVRNPALRLYERWGCVTVAVDGDGFATLVVAVSEK